MRGAVMEQGPQLDAQSLDIAVRLVMAITDNLQQDFSVELPHIPKSSEADKVLKSSYICTTYVLHMYYIIHLRPCVSTP